MLSANESLWNWDHSYATLPKSCFSVVDPTPVRQPKLLIFNEALAAELGLASLSEMDTAALAEIFAGNRLPEGALPLAMAYAGHQFGHFTPLGDGRAILLGEHVDYRQRRHDIQLKGSGITPYSRRGDGRAALAPMLREYLISEAMEALGIPTTRSLAIVTTGEEVHRMEVQPGAVLVRTAASHMRVGTFELFAAMEDHRTLRALLDYTVRRHYPELTESSNPALALLRVVQIRQAELVACWMAVGFVHGVLNTDNVALSGETIDYGPCAFIDRYRPDAVYSSIDRRGRYAYGNQPAITAWNLSRFAESLLPLIDEDNNKAIALAEEVLGGFPEAYERAWLERMARKIGIDRPQQADKALIEDWLQLLDKHGVDFTNGFRALTGDDNAEHERLMHADFKAWLGQLEQRWAVLGIDCDSARACMDAANPRQIPRNAGVEEALNAAESGDLTPFLRALKVLQKPFVEHRDVSAFATTPSAGDQVFTTFCGT